MKLKALTLTALLAMATSASAEVKIALDSKPDLETSGSYNWAFAFGNALKESGMDVREMPRGSVGNEAEKFDQVSTGLLEVSLSDVRAVAQVDPFIYGVRLPYIFANIDHMDRALAAGDVYTRVNENLAEQDTILLALAPLGPASGESPRPKLCARLQICPSCVCAHWMMHRSRCIRRGDPAVQSFRGAKCLQVCKPA